MASCIPAPPSQSPPSASGFDVNVGATTMLLVRSARFRSGVAVHRADGQEAVLEQNHSGRRFVTRGVIPVGRYDESAAGVQRGAAHGHRAVGRNRRWPVDEPLGRREDVEHGARDQADYRRLGRCGWLDGAHHGCRVRPERGRGTGDGCGIRGFRIGPRFDRIGCHRRRHPSSVFGSFDCQAVRPLRVGRRFLVHVLGSCRRGDIPVHRLVIVGVRGFGRRFAVRTGLRRRHRVAPPSPAALTPVVGIRLPRVGLRPSVRLRVAGVRFVSLEFGACPVSGLVDSDDVAPPELDPESVSAPATAAPASIAADSPAVIKAAPSHSDNRSTLAPIHDYVFSESATSSSARGRSCPERVNGRRSNPANV